MALDFSILRSDGPSLHSVAIWEEVHAELQNAAAARACVQLLRVHDYWGDVIENDLEAVKELAGELEVVLPGLFEPASSACRNLLALVRTAMSSKQPLHALPD